jgi:EAL domain-containing protein (putative c-di-GMP-specific phosphodiesterase class I)
MTSGWEYSWLSRLAELLVDILKIDRSFTRRIGGSGCSGRDLDQRVAGEGVRAQYGGGGVETEEQLQMVVELGCQESQGYLHGPPVPFEQLEEMLVGEMRGAGGSGRG